MIVTLCNSMDQIEGLRELAVVDHSKSAFGHIPFSNFKFDAFAQRALSHPSKHCIIKAQKNERSLGFCMCSAGQYFIGDGVDIVTVMVLYVRSDCASSLLGGKIAIRLVQAIEKWAKSIDVEIVVFHVTSGVRMKTSDRFLRRLGGMSLGGNYMLKVNRNEQIA